MPSIAFTKPKPDLGKLIQGLSYERGAQHHCDRLRHAPNNTPSRFRSLALNVLSRSVEPLDNIARVSQQFRARGRHTHTSSGPVQQRRAKLCFQLPELQTKGWLGNMETKSCLGNRSLFGNGDKVAESPNIHADDTINVLAVSPRTHLLQNGACTGRNCCRAFARMTSDPYRQDMAARPTWYLTAFRLPGLVFEDMFADEQR
jgi:hypothetical protein